MLVLVCWSLQMATNKFVGRFDNSCLEDLIEFRKRYIQTYLFVHLPAGKALAYVSSVGDYVHLETNLFGEVIVGFQTDIEFQIEWPETGLFQYKECMYWGSRVPDRQWKRGVYAKNFHIFDPCHRMFAPISFGGIRIDLNSLEAAYKPRDVKTLTQAIVELRQEKMVSVAISRDWGISWSPIQGNNSFLLWRGAKPVAEIDPRSKKITVHFEPLEQEIKDFVRDNREPVWQII